MAAATGICQATFLSIAATRRCASGTAHAGSAGSMGELTSPPTAPKTGSSLFDRLARVTKATGQPPARIRLRTLAQWCPLTSLPSNRRSQPKERLPEYRQWQFLPWDDHLSRLRIGFRTSRGSEMADGTRRSRDRDGTATRRRIGQHRTRRADRRTRTKSRSTRTRR